jgi:hypothetical protein
MVGRDGSNGVVMAACSIVGAGVGTEGTQYTALSGAGLMMCGGGVVASERRAEAIDD